MQDRAMPLHIDMSQCTSRNEGSCTTASMKAETGKRKYEAFVVVSKQLAADRPEVDRFCLVTSVSRKGCGHVSGSRFVLVHLAGSSLLLPSRVLWTCERFLRLPSARVGQ